MACEHSSEFMGEDMVDDVLLSLLQVPDSAWVTVNLPKMDSNSKSRRCAVNIEDTLELGRSAEQYAISCWQAVHGFLSQSPADAIESLGVCVKVESPSQLTSEFLHFAYYEPAHQTVHVCEAAIHSVTGWLETTGVDSVLRDFHSRNSESFPRGRHSATLNAGDFNLMDVVLWHEFYHVWVNQVDRKRRSWKERIKETFSQSAVIREELAAIQFSRMATGLGFHPQVFQWLLQYVFTPRVALRRYKYILRTRVMR